MRHDPPAGTDPHRYLADFEQQLQQARQRIEAVNAAFRAARTTSTSRDGAVTVTVASGGRIESLRLTPKAIELGYATLAATITDTIRTAQVGAARMIEDAVRPVLGDGEGMDFLREQVERGITAIDSTAAPTDRPARKTSRNDDDYYDGPVLR
ncbi:YbaB/EbfC family nucleoid-associated protein [Saccharothrix violaceirubra]|uniref:DNA-binding protein YbaB n=1 Tax=Saccharothrix violaceirubra TaxID=413306 RepID=A0A7W7WY71_9PSEU|nr:YbaB/EbfC family nucleoid-associated protein [Saccharothrix violaceirubra]MBB4967398.1 DNA-binding protein YbaB [Saccharothrix violaceirubra]